MLFRSLSRPPHPPPPPGLSAPPPLSSPFLFLPPPSLSLGRRRSNLKTQCCPRRRARSPLAPQPRCSQAPPPSRLLSRDTPGPAGGGAGVWSAEPAPPSDSDPPPSPSRPSRRSRDDDRQVDHTLSAAAAHWQAAAVSSDSLAVGRLGRARAPRPLRRRRDSELASEPVSGRPGPPAVRPAGPERDARP